jgi:hypothetical protein
MSKMKKKTYFLILDAKNSHLMGAFPHSKEGKIAAKLWVEKLKKENPGKKYLIK